MTAGHSHKFRVKIDETTLSSEIEAQMVGVHVEDSRNSPDLFELLLLDPERRSPQFMLEKTKAKIGSLVSVSVISSDSPGAKDLVKGEVTAIETQYSGAGEGSFTKIRGYDHSHRLFRGRKTRVWKNKTYSDIASAIADEAGLTLGKIDPTTPVYEHVSQFNMSDWQFLEALAAESNREVTVSWGALDFREATDSSEGPPVGTLERSAEPLQLMLGRELVDFRAAITAADQVSEVQARGWDYKAKQPLVYTAPASTTSASIGITPAELAAEFGDPVFQLGSSSGMQQHIQNLATSMAAQIAAGFAEFSGTVSPGNLELNAGKVVSLGGAGKPFDGKYMVTTSAHHWTAERAYFTFFTCSGPLDRSLGGLTNGAGSRPARRIEGVVPAVVTDNKDPEQLGRVKVTYPGVSESYVSDWARVVQIGAGKDGRGWMILPEVNDEVLVAFDQGDVRYPYVLGGVFNGVDKPTMAEPWDSTGINYRAFTSRHGHQIEFFDIDDADALILHSGSYRQAIRLEDSSDKMIQLWSSDGRILLQADKAIQITSSADDVVVSADNIKLSASKSIEIEAPQVKISGDSQTVIKGGTVQINPPGV